MTMAPLRDALRTLRYALRAPGILDHDDVLTIELRCEAGHRFEVWAIQNAPPDMFPINNWGAELTIDGVPHRELKFDGIIVRWPVKMVAFHDNSIGPRPVAESYATHLMHTVRR